MTNTDPGAGRRRAVRRRILAVGMVTAATFAVAAPANATTVTVNIGVANNAYPALRDLNSYMQTVTPGSSLFANPFSSDVAGQVGGFWRGDNSTTLRGITSGNFRKQLISSGPYTAPGAACSTTSACQYGPLTTPDLFLSADVSNVDQVVPTAQGGTCATGTGNGQGGEDVTACPGIGSTKLPFVVGKLAIYVCNNSWNGVGTDPGSSGAPVGADANGSGNGVPTSPNCKATNPSLSSNNMAGLIAWLAASTSHKMSIALPSSAPFGAAAKAALEQADGGMTGFTYDDSSGTTAQNAWPAGTGAGKCEHTGGPITGAVCQVRLEAGISQVRGSVTSGTTQVGLAALSNMKHITWGSGINGPNGVDNAPTGPGGGDDLPAVGDDPNPAYVVDPSDYDDNGPILEDGVVLNTDGTAGVTSNRERVAAAILTGLRNDDTPLALFALYGYSVPAS
jgi:ABC-type molybdate transport system substrate-binding protein